MNRPPQQHSLFDLLPQPVIQVSEGRIFIEKEKWREGCDELSDVYLRAALLRSVLKSSRNESEISEVMDRMAALPSHLQSYIAFDVICNPATTVALFRRVRRNRHLLKVTSRENIQFAWEKHHTEGGRYV